MSVEDDHRRGWELIRDVKALVAARTKYYAPRNAPHYVEFGQWGLAVELAAWDDAVEGNPISPFEAEEMVRLLEETHWLGEAHGDDSMPWTMLHVVDEEGQPVAWEPPLSADATGHPKRGGGHLAGLRRRGRAEFPPPWKRDDVLAHLEDVAANPQPGRVVALPAGLFRAWDVREGVLVEVVVDGDGRLLTGYPVSGPAVHHNRGREDLPVTDTTLDRSEAQLVEELGEAVDAITPLVSAEPIADSIRALYRAGEWQLAVAVLSSALREAGVTLPGGRADQLDRLSEETGAAQILER